MTGVKSNNEFSIELTFSQYSNDIHQQFVITFRNLLNDTKEGKNSVIELFKCRGMEKESKAMKLLEQSTHIICFSGTAT